MKRAMGRRGGSLLVTLSCYKAVFVKTLRLYVDCCVNTFSRPMHYHNHSFLTCSPYIFISTVEFF